ncbi:MAG: CoA transferase [Deltaproteobacteria bacterium]|nr:CoA transferase [Deltaproteobacteria bacterium]
MTEMNSAMCGKPFESMLVPYRALDMTDEKGFLCAKTLADLGCDVIKIEKPGGDRDRRIGPFYHGECHPEESLNWFAFNANKRGITLDIETADGKEIFKKLVKKSDFVIESFPVGYLDGLSIGYSDLSKVNDQVILTSITPFGDSGPYRDYKACDIVAMAMGGLLNICGDPDRPPVTPGFPASYLLGGVEAALGTLMALRWRRISGRGTVVKVSLQDEVLTASWDSVPYWSGSRTISKRSGPFSIRPNVSYRIIWPCKDGYVTFFYFGGQTGAEGNRAIVDWMESEGIDCGPVREQKWESFDWDRLKQNEVGLLEKPLYPFFMSHTKKELYEGAVRRNIILYPLAGAKDILNNQQLKERSYWTEVRHPELQSSIMYPGAFVKSSCTYCGVSKRAPLIGEHNQEIFMGELGFSKEDLISLKQSGVI